MLGGKTMQNKDYKRFFKNRLKNKYLWMAIIALIVNLGIQGVVELPDNFESTANAVLNVLVLLGIINNPSTESQAFFVDENNNGIPDYLENQNQSQG